MNVKKSLFSSFIWFLIFSPIILTNFDYSEASDLNLYIDFDLVGPPTNIPVAPPPIILEPGTVIYYISYYDEPVYYYSGYWYRLIDRRWHRAISHRGPWHYIHHRYVPNIIINIPIHYNYKHRLHDREWHNFRHIKHWKNERHYRYR